MNTRIHVIARTLALVCLVAGTGSVFAQDYFGRQTDDRRGQGFEGCVEERNDAAYEQLESDLHECRDADDPTSCKRIATREYNLQTTRNHKDCQLIAQAPPERKPFELGVQQSDYVPPPNPPKYTAYPPFVPPGGGGGQPSKPPATTRPPATTKPPGHYKDQTPQPAPANPQPKEKPPLQFALFVSKSPCPSGHYFAGSIRMLDPAGPSSMLEKQKIDTLHVRVCADTKSGTLIPGDVPPYQNEDGGYGFIRKVNGVFYNHGRYKSLVVTEVNGRIQSPFLEVPLR